MLHLAQTVSRRGDTFQCRHRRGVAVVFLSMWLPLSPLAAAIEKPLGTVHPSDSRLQITGPYVDRLTVSAIHGRAFNVKDDGGLFPLRRGGLISANQPVKVAPRSGLDLQTSDGGTLELGPDAELVLEPPGRTNLDAMTTGVRLNNGYLKVAVKAPRTGPFNVSFGRWLAELKPGAYVFETRNNESSVCMLNGNMRVSGAQNVSTTPEPYSCVQLTERATAPIRLTGAEWADVGTHRVLNPILTEVSRRDFIKARDLEEARRAANRPPTVPMRPDRDERPSLATSTPAAHGAPSALVDMPATQSAAVPPPRSLPFAPLDDLNRTLQGSTARRPDPVDVDNSAADPVTSAGLMMEAQPPAAGAHTVTMADPAAPSDATPPDGLAGPDGTARETSPLEWIVNVATHSSLESAEFQAAQLRSRNLPASIRRETVRGRTAYRVVVDGLATEQAANGVVRMLVSDLGVRQAWVFRKH